MRTLEPKAIAEGILSGSRRMLAKGITLLESNRPDHRRAAEELLSLILPHTGNSYRIGITGVPGVGKSTFIEAFGMKTIEKGHRVAVLAIDPSSVRGGGSILGDKTRMNKLSLAEQAFIRPSPAGNMSGGVAFATRESVLLCEAAGFDRIIVETVGVGQNDVIVDSMTDCFIALMLPGAGDELQGIKRGMMEMGDLFIINKADGDNAQPAKIAAMQISQATRLFAAKRGWWQPHVATCSALNNVGIDEIIDCCDDFFAKGTENSAIKQRRASQAVEWMESYLKQEIERLFFSRNGIKQEVAHCKMMVQQGQTSPVAAAHRIVEIFENKGKG